MKTSSPVPPTLRFGVFELNQRAGELRKKGMKLRLQGQPVDILAMLLERPGETITREELQKKLWPADTFVDFEQGLNNAMKRLRAALDDDAESPHFIETLPRHGYRFIGSLIGSEQTRAAEVKTTRGTGALIPLAALGVLLTVLGVAGVLVELNFHGWHDRLFRWAKPQIQALAVLPLTNLSGDPEQEYFADGMTEALITELGKISAPRVISRQSVMQYKASKKSLQEIARELNVDAVLEGTVERSGDRVRVTTHLSQAFPERQLWSKDYDRSVRDALSLQGEIARAITDEIQVKLTPEERTHLAGNRSVDPAAQDDFLRAESLAIKGDERNLQAGISHFKKAIQTDPAYARAHAGLAWALILQSWRGEQPARQVLPEAKVAAERAVELDSSLPDAHVSRALVLETEWNWLEADKEHRTAVEVGPNSWGAHSSYAGYLISMGRFDEATAQTKYAAELDPVNPWNRTQLGLAALGARQYNVAIAEFQTVEYEVGLGQAYGQTKQYQKAIAALERAATSERQPFVVAKLAWAYGLAGKRQEALKAIDDLNEFAQRRYVAPSAFVDAYVGLGDKERALTWMEKAYQERDFALSRLKVDPALDPLRSEQRFQAILRRMNFPP